jgi:hypothetical protein
VRDIQDELDFEYFGNLLYLDAIITKAYEQNPTEQRKKMMFALNDIRHYVRTLQMERRAYHKVVDKYKNDRTTLLINYAENRKVSNM